jgi:hypothetical protein
MLGSLGGHSFWLCWRLFQGFASQNDNCLPEKVIACRSCTSITCTLNEEHCLVQGISRGVVIIGAEVEALKEGHNVPVEGPVEVKVHDFLGVGRVVELQRRQRMLLRSGKEVVRGFALGKLKMEEGPQLMQWGSCNQEGIGSGGERSPDMLCQVVLQQRQRRVPYAPAHKAAMFGTS